MRQDIARQIVEHTDRYGWCETLSHRGLWLATQAKALDEQAAWAEDDPGRKVDLTKAPYWLMTDAGGLVPIYDAEDLAEEIDD